MLGAMGYSRLTVTRHTRFRVTKKEGECPRPTNMILNTCGDDYYPYNRLWGWPFPPGRILHAAASLGPDLVIGGAPFCKIVMEYGRER